MQVKQWEYRFFSEELNRNRLIGYLNERGQEGWELFEYDQLFGMYTFLFKRQIN